MRRNYPLIALGIILLVVATLAGLSKMGFTLLPKRLALSHGALMVAGFFGTLISLERAYAVGKSWGYAAPLLTGIGGVATIAGLEQGFMLILLGSLVFVLLFVKILRFQLNLSTVTMAIGAVFLLAGNLLWHQHTQTAAASFWSAFLLLTIAGERIELAQLVGAPRKVALSFTFAIAVYLAGVVLTPLDFASGVRISGAGMLLLFLWLLRYDVAMKSISKQGLVRFIAVALLAAYLWLGVSGVLALAYAGTAAYDAMLHALLLGFVFSMVFGHAPVIFPALLGREMRFLRGFYMHLVLLHLSLLLRVAGNFFSEELLALGGALCAFAIFLFLINNARALV